MQAPLWVGLSTPKQEQFMDQLLRRFRAKGQANGATCFPAPLIMLDVGAAFDFHTALIPEAPRWMQRAGLEWLFRLQKDPRRLWKRHLKKILFLSCEPACN